MESLLQEQAAQKKLIDKRVITAIAWVVGAFLGYPVLLAILPLSGGLGLLALLGWPAAIIGI